MFMLMVKGGVVKCVEFLGCSVKGWFICVGVGVVVLVVL